MKRSQIVIPLLAATTGIIALGGCLALKPHQMDNTAIDEYAAASKQALPPTPDATRDAGIERWKALIADFSKENIQGKVASVYAPETFFNDTLKTIRDPAALEAYLLETAEMLNHSKVEYEDTIISGDDVYIRWRMTYESKTLAKGQDIITIGMSHLRFDPEGKVVLHQDFWDSTRGIFEHVPIIGKGIRMVKKRL